MESKTIKISKENYLWLLKLAAEIQKKEGRRVTFNDVFDKLRKEYKKL